MGLRRATLATLTALSVLGAAGVGWDLVRVGEGQVEPVAEGGQAPLDVARDLANKATHGWLIRQAQISESLPRVR